MRAYARLLKLDAEPLVAAHRRRASRCPTTPRRSRRARRPIPITDSARRSNLIYAALSLAMLGVIAAVLFEWQRERAGAARLDFVAAAQPLQPRRRRARRKRRFRRAGAAEAAAVGIAQCGRAAQYDGHSGGRAGAVRRARAAANGGQQAAHQHEVRARTPGSRSAARDGKTLISQLNPAGSEQAVEGRPPFALIIGNAQHVRLSYDDRPIDLAPHVKVEVARFTLE